MMNHNKQTSERTFFPDDPMLIKNYHHGPSWIPGEVLTGGPRNYKIKLANGAVVCLHVDHMQKRTADSPNTYNTSDDFEDIQPSVKNSFSFETSSAKTVPPESTSTLQRSTHIRKPPNRFSPVTN